MDKSALLFAGQGSQFVGMGKSLYESYSEAKEIFDYANIALDKDIRSMCFEGPKEELDQTLNTQQAIFTYNLAVFNTLKKPKTDFIAGHSLGEVCAAVAAGSISIENGFKVIKKRAELMHEATQKIDGSMIAVIGVKAERIKELLAKIDEAHISNFNSALQTTVSGPKKALQEAKEILSEEAKMVVDLAVSGAFHSPFMQEASDGFDKYLDTIEFKDAKTSLVANVDAKPKLKGNEIKKALAKQISSPVRFIQTLEFMNGHGIENYIEVGPAKTLANLVKRTYRQANVYTTETIDSIQTTLNNLINVTDSPVSD